MEVLIEKAFNVNQFCFGRQLNGCYLHFLFACVHLRLWFLSSICLFQAKKGVNSSSTEEGKDGKSIATDAATAGVGDAVDSSNGKEPYPRILYSNDDDRVGDGDDGETGLPKEPEIGSI